MLAVGRAGPVWSGVFGGLWFRRCSVFCRDVSGGWALFGAERGRGLCGAVWCGCVCSSVCHCALGSERAARLLARRASSRRRAHELVEESKGGRA